VRRDRQRRGRALSLKARDVQVAPSCPAHSPSKTGVNALVAGHPRLSSEICRSKAWMAGIGERRDAVLRTAMPGHDGVYLNVRCSSREEAAPRRLAPRRRPRIRRCAGRCA
jgi:hypothetical protein